MKTEGEVRVSRVILENSAVCPGSAVQMQAGVILPAHQVLLLTSLLRTLGHTGTTRAKFAQHILTDADVKAKHNYVDPIHKKQTSCFIPGKWHKQHQNAHALMEFIIPLALIGLFKALKNKPFLQ